MIFKKQKRSEIIIYLEGLKISEEIQDLSRAVVICLLLLANEDSIQSKKICMDNQGAFPKVRF